MSAGEPDGILCLSWSVRKEKRLPDKMVSHNWGNLFSHLIAALFADAAGHTGFRQVLEWMRLGDAGLLRNAGREGGKGAPAEFSVFGFVDRERSDAQRPTCD